MKIHYLVNAYWTNLSIKTDELNEHIKSHSLMSGSLVKPFIQDYQYMVIGSVPNYTDGYVMVNLKPVCDNAKKAFEEQYKK